jgi:hypothetical protein
MSEMNHATAATRVAIECLTLWLESDRPSAAKRIARLQHDPDGPGADTIIVGLLNLGMLLVVELARAQGAEDLCKRAGEILRNLSPRLPE